MINSPVKQPQSVQAPMQQQAKPSCSYPVKVMNPGFKRDYTMHKFRGSPFQTVDELRDRLLDTLLCGVTQLGYIVPGHGLKGKQQWMGMMIWQKCTVSTKIMISSLGASRK